MRVEGEDGGVASHGDVIRVCGQVGRIRQNRPYVSGVAPLMCGRLNMKPLDEPPATRTLLALMPQNSLVQQIPRQGLRLRARADPNKLVHRLLHDGAPAFADEAKFVLEPHGAGIVHSVDWEGGKKRDGVGDVQSVVWE